MWSEKDNLSIGFACIYGYILSEIPHENHEDCLLFTIFYQT